MYTDEGSVNGIVWREIGASVNVCVCVCAVMWAVLYGGYVKCAHFSCSRSLSVQGCARDMHTNAHTQAEGEI